jgi:enamine deaminase RidA (YjgF/YER057c/UK114 family)
MPVEHLNPEQLNKNPAFTNVIVVTGQHKTIYIGGQNAIGGDGKLVGKGDIVAQTEQVLTNIQVALTSAGAGPEHVVKWNLYLVQGQPLQPGFQAFQKMWGNRPNPPTITMAYVAGLAHPDYLLEMDAIAVVPE